jgi:hypothetical protein
MRNLLKFITTRRIASIAAGVAMMGVLLGGNVGTAFAADPTPATGIGTFDIGGGSLSDSIGTIGFNGGTAFSLDGTDHPAVAISLPITVNDFTGTGSGWNISIKATAFTTTGGTVRTLPTPPSITDVTPSLITGTLPTNSVSSSYPITAVPVDTAVPLYNAAVNTGMGSVLLTPAMTMDIPAATYAGSYSSTFTVAMTSGPTA